MNEIDELNILIAGVGGQGNLLASRVICGVAMLNDLKVSVNETYGASQRGGSVLSHIRIGELAFSPLVPKRRGDLLLGFEPLECLRQTILYLKEGGGILCNSYPIYPIDVISEKFKYPSLEEIRRVFEMIAGRIKMFDATALAIGAGDLLSLNMVMVGALASDGGNPFPRKCFEEVIEGLPNREKNILAFDSGWRASKTLKT